MGTTIDTPSGDLKRDLAGQKRISLWRPQPQIRAVRAMPDLGPRILRFVLATPGVKRDGHSVDCSPEAWRLPERCPMLWSHGYGDSKSPPLPQIGEWVSVEFEQDNGDWRMVGDADFASWDLPETLFRMYTPKDKGGDGMRGATSIGWTPLEAVPNDFGGYHMTLNELNEASLVAMGADPNALQIMRSAVSSGKLPEKYVDHLLTANRLVRAAEGKAYLLDFRERIEVRSKHVGVELKVGDRVKVKPGKAHDDMTKDKTGTIEIVSSPALGVKFDGMDMVHKWYVAEEVELSGDDAAERKGSLDALNVRILDSQDDAVSFDKVAGGVGIVLQHRGGKPDAKMAQRQLQLCRQAITERKAPVLDAQWRATAVVADRPMKLDVPAGEEARREQVVRELTDALEKGAAAVLPSGWSLRSASFTRSDRSDALDVLTAQLWAFFCGATDPIQRICWQGDTVWYEDATGESYSGSISTEDRIEREIKVARSMLSATVEVLDAIEATLEPEPEITGTAMTASFQRVGKKYAAATVKKLKEMAEHHSAAAAIAASMLEEAEALAKAEAETASGESDLVRLAAELDAAVDTPPETTPPNDPPATRNDPFADLTRSLSGDIPPRSTLADLAESLRGAA